MTGELLCVGDIHLGRRPARLPAALGLDPETLTPVSAWGQVVELALERGSAAVLLAGDVVESENAWFEAYGPLERGVRRLVEAGIEVCAVAGNHDAVALPRLARALDGFRLLGEGGRWEVHVLESPEVAGLRVAGWSFPGRSYDRDPLEGFPALDEREGPVVGLLHCDLDASAGDYAPVRRSRLEALPVDAWLLGHLHGPSLGPGPRPVGYLGSLVGLDPSETGEHGVWSLERDPAGGFRAAMIPLAPLRWEHRTLDAAGLGGAGEELDEAVLGLMRESAAQAAAASPALRALGCRIDLVGRSAAWRKLAERVAGSRWEELLFEHQGVSVFIDRVACRVDPDIDLEALAAESNPLGLLARELLEVRNGGPAWPSLRQELEEEFRRALHGAGLNRWVAGRMDEEDLRRALREAGGQALGALFDQKQGDGA
ncbi:MAG: DNA repair exonuclease [Acidobacteriota bacterium]|nr:DNA repair exonuclease [Acidobacteriota bacterium]MDQ7087887.1 DNA repair exonuclease [Acidobacteriota bacterium]